MSTHCVSVLPGQVEAEGRKGARTAVCVSACLWRVTGDSAVGGGGSWLETWTATGMLSKVAMHSFLCPNKHMR